MIITNAAEMRQIVNTRAGNAGGIVILAKEFEARVQEHGELTGKFEGLLPVERKEDGKTVHLIRVGAFSCWLGWLNAQDLAAEMPRVGQQVQLVLKEGTNQNQEQVLYVGLDF